jgi:hypothetical protein
MRPVPSEFPQEYGFWDFSQADSRRSPNPCRPSIRGGGKWEWDRTADAGNGTASDVLANVDACELFVDLADRGIVLASQSGRLVSPTPERLTEADRAGIATHRDALRLLSLIVTDATLDRLDAFRPGALSGRRPKACVIGWCYVCGLAWPRHRAVGRCGWCALAARLVAGAPLSADLLALFDDSIAGQAPRGGPSTLFEVPA